MAGQQEFYTLLARYLPGPVAWVISILCWPLANFMKALPELVATVLLHRREERRIKIDEEKWTVEKQELLDRVRKLSESEVKDESEDDTCI